MFHKLNALNVIQKKKNYHKRSSYIREDYKWVKAEKKIIITVVWIIQCIGWCINNFDCHIENSQK